MMSRVFILIEHARQGDEVLTGSMLVGIALARSAVTDWVRGSNVVAERMTIAGISCSTSSGNGRSNGQRKIKAWG